MNESEHKEQDVGQSHLREVALLFLKLGCIGFGGPAAHIAMMRQEVVQDRKWLSDPEFLDLVGATNLIPGPNSTEMAIHLGLLRSGWAGLVAAGTLFILPAMGMVLALAWAYVEYGSTPELGWVLYGIKPVVLAVVLQALWGLGRVAIKSVPFAIVGIAVLGLYLLGVNEIALLLLGGILVLVANQAARLSRRGIQAMVALPLLGFPGLLGVAPATAAPFSLTQLFFIFLKIGAVLYGSGYVLLAFVRADFVERLGWLTDQQLIDAIAIGQFTPGPVLTTATFIGYVAGGWPAALAATAGIFLPSFAFVALLRPVLPWIRRTPWTRTLLDGVNVASLGLMAGVTWQLGRSAMVDPFAAILFLAAFAVLLRFRVNSAWVVLAGGMLGAGYKGFIG